MKDRFNEEIDSFLNESRLSAPFNNPDAGIIYNFVAYEGSSFVDNCGDLIDFDTIKDNFYKIDGRLGKITHLGYTNVSQQGYSGGYDSYGFVFKDDLSKIILNGGEVLKGVID